MQTKFMACCAQIKFRRLPLFFLFFSFSLSLSVFIYIFPNKITLFSFGPVGIIAVMLTQSSGLIAAQAFDIKSNYTGILFHSCRSCRQNASLVSVFQTTSARARSDRKLIRRFRFVSHEREPSAPEVIISSSMSAYIVHGHISNPNP